MTDRDSLRGRLDAVEDAIGDDEFTVETIWGEGEPEGDPDFVIRQGLVMFREDAEREGREILGPADTPGDRDAVRVRHEGHRAGATDDGAGGDPDA